MANYNDLRVQQMMAQRAASRKGGFFAQQPMELPPMSRQEALQQQFLANRYSSPHLGAANVGAGVGYGMRSLFDKIRGRGQQPQQQQQDPRQAVLFAVQQYMQANPQATYKEALTEVAKQLTVKGDQLGPELYEYAEDFDKGSTGKAQGVRNFRHPSGEMATAAPGTPEEAELVKKGYLVGEPVGPDETPNAIEWVPGETIMPSLAGHTVSRNRITGKPLRVIKTGPEETITYTWDEYLNKGGRNKIMQDYLGKAEGTFNFVEQIDRTEQAMRDNPNALATPGKILEIGSEIGSTIKSLVNSQTQSGNKIDESLLNFDRVNKNPFFRNLVAQGNDAARVKALFIDLAYAEALSREPGARFTEQDIQRGLDTMGGTVSNAEGALRILKEKRNIALDRLENYKSVFLNNVSVPHIEERIKKYRGAATSTLTDEEEARLKSLGY